MIYPPFPFQHFSYGEYYLDINKEYIINIYNHHSVPTVKIHISGYIKRNNTSFQKDATFCTDTTDIFIAKIQKFKDYHDFKEKFEDKLNEKASD